MQDDSGRARSWRLFLLGCWLCLAPLLVAHYPPMTDIPQHAAQIAGLQGKFAGTWRYADLFQVRAFTPYWLGYGLVLALAPLFGVLTAMKVVIGLAMVAFPWSAARYCRSRGVPQEWLGWLFPLSLGFAFHWGFLNFIVAMPLAFLFLEKAPALLERQRARAWLTIALFGHALFFAHILIAGFVCAVAALEQMAPGRTVREWLRRIAPFFSLAPIVILWLAFTLGAGGQAREPLQWGLGPERVTHLLARIVAAPEGIAGMMLGAAAVAFPWVAGARWRRDPGRWAPFLLFLAFALFFPVYAMGNASTASRFAVFGLPFYFACFEPGVARERAFHWGPVIATLGVAMVGWHTLRASVVELEARGYRHVMASATPGGRVLALMFDNESRASTAPVFLHFPGWYQAEHGGLSEPSFSQFYGMPLGPVDPEFTNVGMWFAWKPSALEWAPAAGDRYDYLVVRTREDPRAWLTAVSGCAVRPLSHDGEWWLFGRAPAPSCPITAPSARPPAPR